jgi:hypothetical protein
MGLVVGGSGKHVRGPWGEEVMMMAAGSGLSQGMEWIMGADSAAARPHAG